MARHGRRGSPLSGVPKGWCWRWANKPSDKGIPLSKVARDNKGNLVLRTSLRKKGLMITYGCPKGRWRPSGKYKFQRLGKGGRKKWVEVPGKCDAGMRAVRIMKPTAAAKKSKSSYHCRSKRG